MVYLARLLLSLLGVGVGSVDLCLRCVSEDFVDQSASPARAAADAFTKVTVFHEKQVPFPSTFSCLYAKRSWSRTAAAQGSTAVTTECNQFQDPNPLLLACGNTLNLRWLHAHWLALNQWRCFGFATLDSFAADRCKLCNPNRARTQFQEQAITVCASVDVTTRRINLRHVSENSTVFIPCPVGALLTATLCAHITPVPTQL